MKAILHRLRRIEEKLLPQYTETAEDRRSAELAEQIRERRRRRLEAVGLPFEESPPPPLPAELEGRRLSVGETLWACVQQRRELRAARPEAH
jgi:hypothetical protein